MQFTAPSPRASAILALLLLIVAHLPLRTSGYIQDDHVAIETNPIVERGDMGEIFSTSYWAGANGQDESLYRPLVLASFAVEAKLFGAQQPGPSHKINLAIHAGTTLAFLAMLVAAGFRPWAVLAATSLFAIHPVHVEAVAGLVGRAELMAAGFGFLALVATLHFDPSSSQGLQRRWSVLAAAALLAALLSKETAAAFPILMLWIAWTRLDRGDAVGPGIAKLLRVAGWLWPSLLAALFWFGLRVRALQNWFVEQPIHPLDNPLAEEGGLTQFSTALAVLAEYSRLLFLPFGLSIDHSGGSIPLRANPANLASFLGLMILLFWIALAVRGRKSSGRRLTFLAVLFLVPYAIVGNLLFDVGALFAERFLYLPSAAFCGLAGWALATIESGEIPHEKRGRAFGRRMMLIILSAWLGAFALLTWARCTEWQDDRKIFSSALSVRPDSPRANFVVGKQLSKEDRPDLGLPFLDRAIELHPGHFPAHLEKGVALGKLGRMSDAAETFERTIEINPQSFRAHQNLAIAYRGLGRSDDAVRSLRMALAWEPRAANAWAEMGNLRLERREYAAAIEAYRIATDLGRNDLAPRIEQARRLATGRESP